MPTLDRSAVAKAAAAGLRRFAPQIAATNVFVGFDGFVDSIIRVVDQREDADHFTPMATIERFGTKILAAAGQSTNFELVITLQKLGGNGPIMANALAAAGLKVDYVGNVGYPSVHPAFADFAKAATVHSIADPGFTDALEFEDGKLMLGKHITLKDVNLGRVHAVLGADTFNGLVRQSKLLGLVNWTMLNDCESIWHGIMQTLAKAGGPKRIVFIDLADPEKRSRASLRDALELMREFANVADVVLGANLKESSQIAEVLGLTIVGDHEVAIEKTARAIREKLGLFGVVIHPRKGAAAALLTDEGLRSAAFSGPFVAKPKLSTGAGDNFNAGFCVGLLAGLPVEQCLCAGVGTSGYYVRNAHSPTLAALADFCDDLPAPQ